MSRGFGRDELLALFRRLVETPSPSGHERPLADLVLEYVANLGFTVSEDDSNAQTGTDCGNILVTVPGRGGGTTVLLGAHIDTVAVSGPVTAVVRDGSVYSDGTTILGADDKTAVTLLLALLRDLAAEAPAGRVEVLFTTSEEIGLRGAKAFDLASVQARAGFVFDSSGPLGTIITAAPAQTSLTATFTGVAAHAGIEPERGRSAIEAAAAAIAAMPLGRIDEMTTSNVGIIRGGVATNIVAEQCTVEAEARSRDGARLAAQIQAMLDAAQTGAAAHDCDVTVDIAEQYAAFALDAQQLPVRIATAAMLAIGLAPVVGATGGGSDVNVFNAKGLASVNLAIGYESVHTSAESMPLDRLWQGYELVHALVVTAGAISAGDEG
ncbi:MAG: M20/M25/M40 family metallo-hydrolase [Thermoleophilia bacterium]